MVSLQNEVIVERLWQTYFQKPTEWWDSRRNRVSRKMHLQSPYFRRKSTKESLWVASLNTPDWVMTASKKTIAESHASSCGEGRTGKIVDLRISGKDESSWAAQISRHVRCGQGRQALKIYQEMLRTSRGIPTSHAFVAALKACSGLRDLESAKQIHADVVESGFELDIFVGNVLVDVYAKCGSLVDARQVFEGMPLRNVVSWTAMILGYCQMEEGIMALQLYTRMQQECVTANDRTFVVALKACSSLLKQKDSTNGDRRCMRSWCLKQVRTIHTDVLRSGCEGDVFVGNMLVDVYAKCGSLVDARHVFEKIPHRDVVSWNAMISGYALMEAGEEALQLYTRMQQEGVVPDDRTFVAALKACSSLATFEGGDQECGNKKCLRLVRAIHTDVVKSGSESAVFVGTMLVDVYAKCGSLVDARRIFERMPLRNVVSWTAMIVGYAQVEEGEVALDLYTRMKQEGVAPDSRAFVGALKACSSLAAPEGVNTGGGYFVKKRCLQQVRDIHSAIVKSGSESDVYVANMLVLAYAKCGSQVDARCVFEKMPHRNVVSWTVMISSYAHIEEGEVALQLYTQMQHEGVVPDDRTFVAALMACGNVAGVEKGKEIHAQISKTGLETTDPFVSSALIDMYGKCGDMLGAQQVFDALPKRTIVAWNALMAGYARQGDSEAVFSFFERMKQQGIQPSGVTFLIVLTACSHLGLLDKGRKYFDAMRQDHHITPTAEHHCCMVDLLGRAGQLEEAMAMAQASKPSSVAWKTVLGACLKWSKVELGRQAFECAVRLDRTDAAAYVLMSNIYAAAQMFQEKNEIQAMKVRAGAWKQSAKSWWTDDGGIVHAFVVGDQTPPVETKFSTDDLRDDV